MNEKNREHAYVAVRMLELLFAAAFVVGIMWQGAESFALTTPQFLILYGLIGTLTCEIASRALKKTAKFREVEKRARK